MGSVDRIGVDGYLRVAFDGETVPTETTADEVRELRWNECSQCGSGPSEHEVRNHDLMWHDGDVYCLRCGNRVRTYDAG
jgi:hypothetical protein